MIYHTYTNNKNGNTYEVAREVSNSNQASNGI